MVLSIGFKKRTSNVGAQAVAPESYAHLRNTRAQQVAPLHFPLSKLFLVGHILVVLTAITNFSDTLLNGNCFCVFL
jgi:hypothetical protein